MLMRAALDNDGDCGCMTRGGDLLLVNSGTEFSVGKLKKQKCSLFQRRKILPVYRNERHGEGIETTETTE